MRGEPCVCRGWIQVEDERDELEIRDAVRAHNATEQHRTYMGYAPAHKELRYCPGVDACCGRLIGPREALCYPCARREALGRRLVPA